MLTATGGVTGTYILTGNTAQSFFGGLGAVYTPTSVVLQMQQTKSFASAGGTPNQIATGGGADTLPAGNALVNTLLGLPDAATAQGAFDRLSGEIYASSRTALVEDSRLVREAALARLQATGAGTVVWGQGFGDWGSADGDDNAARLSHRTTGFIGGADTAAGDWRLGALAGYSRDGITVADRASSGSGDSYHLGIYGGTQAAGINLRGGASYSWHAFNIARAITFNGFAAPASGHVTGDTVQGFAEAGYPLDAGSVSLEPFGNIAHVDVSLGGLQESGGAADLRVGGNDSAVTFTTLGAHLSHAAELRDTSLSLRASLGWRHALGDVVPASVNSFVGGGGFAVAGVPVARDNLAAEAGLDAAIADDLTLSASYTGQYATNARDSGGKLGLRWMLQ